MEEPGDGSGSVPADHEDGVPPADVEERVELHREPALRLRAAPLRRHTRKLCRKRPVDVAGEDERRRVAGPLEPVDGLADLADRAPLERERADVDHAFIAVVERPQAVPTVERQAALARPEHGDAPVALVRELLELRQKALDRIRVSDRIARDDGDAGDHPVREEGPTVQAKEVRLARSEDEGRQRVRAMFVEEPPHEQPFVLVAVAAVSPWGEPAGEQPEAAGDAEQKHRQRKPVPEGPAQVGRSPRIQPRERGRRLAERKPERVGPVGLDPVDPERRRAVGEDRQCVGEGEHADLQPGRRIAASVEVVAARDQRERKRDAHRRLFVVEPLEDVQHCRDENERDGQLPGPAAPAPKTSREHDQRQPSGDDQCACQPRNGVRRYPFDQLHAAGELRRHGRGDVEDSRHSDEGGEHEWRAPRRLCVCSSEQRAAEPDQASGEVERGHVESRTERLPVGDLPDGHE
jgi:hypothetical protein